jgi:hypothetical protein
VEKGEERVNWFVVILLFDDDDVSESSSYGVSFGRIERYREHVYAYMSVGTRSKVASINPFS